MYQPRRVNEAPAAGVPDGLDGASLAAFRSAPRRATTSRAAAFTARVAPAGLSVALVATVGTILVNRGASETDSLVAVPERSDQVSRDTTREELPQRAVAEGLATDAAEKAPATEAPASAAPVAAAWSTQFGTVAGKKYAQSATSVKAQPSEDAADLSKLDSGATIDVTDIVTDGWRQVVVEKKVGWVADDVLGSAAPKPKATAGATTSSGKVDPNATGYSGPSVLGLKPKAMVVYNAVMANFKVPSVGGWRSSSLSSHQCGLAIDFMTYTDYGLGDSIADYVIANASSFGVTHIIFKQRIWTPYRPYWRPMADRGGVTANHFDHVHVALADHC